MNMVTAAFPSNGFADDFYISKTTQWLFLGFTWPYKRLELAGIYAYVHLHRK